MESTFNDNGPAIRADADVRKTGASDVALELHGPGQEVPNLTADVQDLLGRLSTSRSRNRSTASGLFSR